MKIAHKPNLEAMTPEERARRLVEEMNAGRKGDFDEVNIADAIRAAVEDTRREMLFPCAACAARGELVTRRMNSEPGECPHGYGFDTCTQCHEAFHAGRRAEREDEARGDAREPIADVDGNCIKHPRWGWVNCIAQGPCFDEARGAGK